jgi:hypothetical protein
MMSLLDMCISRNSERIKLTSNPSLSVFLTKDFLNMVASQVLVENTNYISSIILLNAVFAIGCYIVKLERGGDVTAGLAEAYARFDIAEKYRSLLAVGEHSKEKFLVWVLPSYF